MSKLLCVRNTYLLSQWHHSVVRDNGIYCDSVLSKSMSAMLMGTDSPILGFRPPATITPIGSNLFQTFSPAKLTVISTNPAYTT